MSSSIGIDNRYIDIQTALSYIYIYTCTFRSYFGVSRSSSAVIAYMMKRHGLDYQPAYELVLAKRRFVQPNAGFVSQLKLFRRMGYKIDPNYQRYKMHRLRLAGEQMRKAKILPQSFHSVVRPDPDITRENPEPIVFRCRRCRRVLASKSHVLEHRPRGMPQQQEQDQVQEQEQQQPLAETTGSGSEPRLLDQLAERIRKASLGSPSHENLVTAAAAAAAVSGSSNNCRSLLFVEPIAWMHRIMLNTQGRLYCPKCEQKIGNFSWVNGRRNNSYKLLYQLSTLIHCIVEQITLILIIVYLILIDGQT